MFGINGAELLVLAVVALLVVGPERLPEYASQLGRLVREARRMAVGAREQVRQELGPDFDDIDWQKLDPRQYDPRRIVREALTDLDDEPEPSAGRRSGSAGRPGARADDGGSARTARPSASSSQGATAAAAGAALGVGASAGRSPGQGERAAGGAGARSEGFRAPYDTEAT
ncbi:Sec-independent protein translocase protein TatB [Thalassiella azotivora]